MLERGPERMLTVRVTDDGRGLGVPVSTAGGHRGILGMQERAALLGGAVTVADAQGGGVEVVAVLPWKSADAAAEENR